MSKEQLREKFAEIAHDAWAGWMKYMMERTIIVDKPEHRICPQVVMEKHTDRWRRQMDTPYADLPENEKESDRKEADKYLAAMKPMLDRLKDDIKFWKEEANGPEEAQ